MISFLAIVIGTLLLPTAFLGVGRLIERESGAASALVRGSTVFLVLCATAWFFKFPAGLLALPLWLLVTGGVLKAVRSQSFGSLAAGLVGCGIVGTLYALPFLLYPGLLAYAHHGTDQWGYAAVSRWLQDHSVDELPIIDNKPGRDWIWLMLTVKDRPLLYVALAALAAAGGVESVIAYFILPAALTGSVFLALFWEKAWLERVHPAGRLGLGLAVALQPIVLLHFQFQFLGGVVAALLLMLLVIALLHVQAQQSGATGFFAFAMLNAVLGIGLYSVTVQLVVLALLAVIVGFNLLKRLLTGSRLTLHPTPRGILWLGTLALAFVCYWKIRVLAPQPLTAPMAAGEAGHVWAHISSPFGLTDLSRWYQPDGPPSDPAGHRPHGATVSSYGAIGALALAVIQSWRWWRLRRDLAALLIFTVCAVVLYRAAPPSGSHWLLSRSVPIFGSALLVGLAASVVGDKRRSFVVAAMTCACLPLLLAAPRLVPFFTAPVHVFVPRAQQQPPEGVPWGCLAYAYYFEERIDIDWTTAPDCFRAMTHYMPEEIRPKLPTATEHEK